MKIELEAREIKTLKKETGLYSYSIKTKNGVVRCSEIDSLGAAIKHAEDNLKQILKSILSK